MVACVTEENVGSSLWLRVERQVFHRLAKTGAVVLNFHTYIERPDSIFSSADRALQFARTLENISPDTHAYRHMTPAMVPLLSWLNRRSNFS
jgi:hypothetical protein